MRSNHSVCLFYPRRIVIDSGFAMAFRYSDRTLAACPSRNEWCSDYYYCNVSVFTWRRYSLNALNAKSFRGLEYSLSWTVKSTASYAYNASRSTDVVHLTFNWTFVTGNIVNNRRSNCSRSIFLWCRKRSTYLQRELFKFFNYTLHTSTRLVKFVQFREPSTFGFWAFMSYLPSRILYF